MKKKGSTAKMRKSLFGKFKGGGKSLKFNKKFGWHL
jgi:hypothetical protein